MQWKRRRPISELHRLRRWGRATNFFDVDLNTSDTVALGVLNEQHFWAGLCRELGLEGLEDLGFEERDAVEAPGGIGEFGDELGFGWAGGLVFITELAEMFFVSGGIFGGNQEAAGAVAIFEGVEPDGFFAFGGLRSGGVLGVLLIGSALFVGD